VLARSKRNSVFQTSGRLQSYLSQYISGLFHSEPSSSPRPFPSSPARYAPATADYSHLLGYHEVWPATPEKKSLHSPRYSHPSGAKCPFTINFMFFYFSVHPFLPFEVPFFYRLFLNSCSGLEGPVCGPTINCIAPLPVRSLSFASFLPLQYFPPSSPSLESSSFSRHSGFFRPRLQNGPRRPDRLRCDLTDLPQSVWCGHFYSWCVRLSHATQITFLPSFSLGTPPFFFLFEPIPPLFFLSPHHHSCTVPEKFLPIILRNRMSTPFYHEIVSLLMPLLQSPLFSFLVLVVVSFFLE